VKREIRFSRQKSLVVEIGRMAKEIESGLGKFCVGEGGRETGGGQFGRKVGNLVGVGEDVDD
jgi:hypothetical protein